MWKEIAAYYNFSYSVQTDLKKQWGVNLGNDTFNGMVGMLQRNESDIGLGPFYFYAERRFIVADPSFVYDEGGEALLSGFDFTTGLVKKRDNLNGLATLAQPFEPFVWLFSFLTILVLAFILYLRNISFYHVEVNYSKKQKFFKFLKIILRNTSGLIITLLKQHFKKFEKSTFENYFWACALLTIPAFYSTFIFAKIVSRPVFVVETLEDVAKLPEIEIALWKDSFFDSKIIVPKIVKDFPELGTQIASGSKKIRNIPQNEITSDQTLNSILDGKLVSLLQTGALSQTLSNRVKNRQCCGFYVGKTYYSSLFSMLLNKNLKLEIKNAVNKKILQLTQSGLFIRIKNKMKPSNVDKCLVLPKSKNMETPCNPINLSDLGGILLCLVVLETVAFLVFIAEYFTIYFFVLVILIKCDH